MNAFDEAVAQHKRYQQPFSCILLDIDDFKAINDVHGHPIGDLVLKETAEQIASQIRETDLLGRYGGEEFLIILPNTQVTQAEHVAEKIRATIEGMRFGEKGLCVTVSQGICDTQVKVSKANESLLHNADFALYEAKKNGKNRTVTYGVFKYRLG
jgi:polar amino acid transport system substrate-binding protein